MTIVAQELRVTRTGRDELIDVAGAHAARLRGRNADSIVPRGQCAAEFGDPGHPATDIFPHDLIYRRENNPLSARFRPARFDVEQPGVAELQQHGHARVGLGETRTVSDMRFVRLAHRWWAEIELVQLTLLPAIGVEWPEPRHAADVANEQEVAGREGCLLVAYAARSGAHANLLDSFDGCGTAKVLRWAVVHFRDFLTLPPDKQHDRRYEAQDLRNDV